MKWRSKPEYLYIRSIFLDIRNNMVQAVIHIDENTNRVLNIVKAKFGLKDKSQAISLIVNEYENHSLEPALRPEYNLKLAKIINGKHLSREEFEKEVA